MNGSRDATSSAAPGACSARLDIRLSDAKSTAPAGHELLVAFHFGAPHPDLEHPAAVGVDLACLQRPALFENWWYRGEVRYRRAGRLRIAECADYAVVVLHTDEAGPDDLRAVTHAAYDELVNGIRATRHPRIVKVWNYLGGINDGDGDAERYRQFSVGRSAAFRALGIDEEHAPTATAIGTRRDTGLTLIALSSDRAVSLVENPRQVSAFRYPRQYGPSSPAFSRGGWLARGDEHLCLISGTAAVVGHRTQHPCDVAAQTDETLRNLASLCDAISKAEPHAPPLTLGRDSLLRVYLRRPDDLELVAAKLERAFGADAPATVFLGGAICRRELLVEIDGVRVTTD